MSVAASMTTKPDTPPKGTEIRLQPQVVVGLISTPNVPVVWMMNMLNEMRNVSGILLDTIKPLDRARNNVIERFLVDYPYATHLLFWDTDVLAPPTALIKLLQFNLPIVSGLYVQKMPPFYPLMNVRIAENTYRHIIRWEENALVECDSAGFGYCLIRRDVLQRMEPPWAWMSSTSQCILPGQTVLGDNKKIENARVGDTVITEHGWGQVLKTFKRRYTGKILTILPRIVRLPIQCTPEHRLLTQRGWTLAKDLTKSDYLCYPILDSEDIEKVDIRSFVKYSSERNGRIYGDVRNANSKKASKGLPSEISLTDAMLRLFGYFIAEGCVDISSGRVLFSFSKDERDFANFVLSTCKDELGVNGVVRRDNGDNIVVEIYSTILAQLFKAWFGQRAENKHMPDWMFKLPKEKISVVLKALYEGDGYMSERILLVTTTSKTLATQVTLCLAKLGVVTTVHPHKQTITSYKPGSQIYFLEIQRTKDFNTLAEAFNLPYRKDKKRTTSNSSYIRDNKVWIPIGNIQSTEYDGDVYDLEITPEHNYMLESMLVKNSEDYYFFTKAQKLGYKVYVDSGLKLGHLGEYTFSIDNFKMFQQAEMEKSMSMGIHVKERVKQENV